MAAILRVISKDQKQFDRFKTASKLYQKDVTVYRVTKPNQLDLMHSNLSKIVLLPKGFDCMKAFEEKELRNKMSKYHLSFYALTEKKFKEFEAGPNVVVDTLEKALNEVAEEDADLIQLVKERQGQPTIAVNIDDLLKV